MVLLLILFYLINMYLSHLFKGMEHIPNIFMSFDKYLFLEVINPHLDWPI